MARLLTSKRGQTPADVIYIFFILAAVAIAGLVTAYMYTETRVQLENNTEFNRTEVREALQGGETVTGMYDFLILFVMLGAALGLMVIGYFIDAHSVFFPIFILALLIGAVLCGVLSYVWVQFSGQAVFAQALADKFIITDHIMNNLALYFSIVGILSLVATYAKTRRESGI